MAAAFSPNGEYVVTGDGERNIYLWKTATGERVYRFPREHAAPVSTLHFTPQCRVISVGRDNVVHIWRVGDENAAVERTLDHRSGEVTQLGVTDDGNWMALDHDKTRLHISSTDKEGVTERVLNSQNESTYFGPFAIFSPKVDVEGHRLLLTASNQGRLVQLWRHDASEDRTREMVRLVPTNNVPATVAAFTPFAENGFIVVGTERGDIHLWARPPKAEIERRWTAKISYIEDSIDPTGRQRKIWATLENDPIGPTRLKPGGTAALVIRPPQPK
jgi:WD40 repeat protein